MLLFFFLGLRLLVLDMIGFDGENLDEMDM